MDACGCANALSVFDEKTAKADLARYRSRGPDRTTRMLLDMIRLVGLRHATVLDIGGGIGVIGHELVNDGADHVVLVDASTSALDVARDEAHRRGHVEQLEFIDGDFVSRAPSIDPAQIVTLDRVVCCYADVSSLVRMSASHAHALYGLVLPRDRAIVRLGLRALNVWYRLRGVAYRAYAHPNRFVDSLVADAGLHPRTEARTFFWRVVLYHRPNATA